MSADRPSTTENDDAARSDSPPPAEMIMKKSKSRSKSKAKAGAELDPSSSSQAEAQPALDAQDDSPPDPAAIVADESLDESLDAIINEAKQVEAPPPAEVVAAPKPEEQPADGVDAKSEETPLPVTIDEDTALSPDASAMAGAEEKPAAADDGAAAAAPDAVDHDVELDAVVDAESILDSMEVEPPPVGTSEALSELASDQGAGQADDGSSVPGAMVEAAREADEPDTASMALGDRATAAGSVDRPPAPAKPATDEELLDKIVLPAGATPMPTTTTSATDYQSGGLSDEDSTVISPMPPVIVADLDPVVAAAGSTVRRRETPRPRTVTQPYAPLTGLAAMVAATTPKPLAKEGSGSLRKAGESLRKLADKRVDWSVGQLAVVVVAAGLLGGVAVSVTHENPNGDTATRVTPVRPAALDEAPRPLIRPHIAPLPPLAPAAAAGAAAGETAAPVERRTTRPRAVAARKAPVPVTPVAAVAEPAAAAAPPPPPAVKEVAAAPTSVAAAPVARPAPARKPAKARKTTQTAWVDPFGQ